MYYIPISIILTGKGDKMQEKNQESSEQRRARIQAIINMAGLKDIVKIEDRELAPDELNKIALIAPNATFNIIRNFNVGKKHTVEIPNTIEGIVRCENPNCISNKKEPITSKCIVKSKNPAELKCYYCDRDIADIISNII